MKAIYRCEYCDKMGIAEEIIKHESECIYNKEKRSCITCRHSELASFNKFVCKIDRDIPGGQYYENCSSYEWDEKDHSTKNPSISNTLFGGIF